MLRRLFHLDAVFVMLLTLAVLWILQSVTLQVDFLNPLARSIGDFHLSDVVFAKLRTTEITDTNIVLVNIGELNRAEIAREIRRISAESPKVIGIDAFFMREKSSELDIPLAEALVDAPHIVLCSKLRYNQDSSRFDSLLQSHPKFSSKASTGFANLINEDENDYITIRNFSPSEIFGRHRELAFATAIAAQVDSTSVARLLARGNPTETINFRGDYGHFYTLDAETVLQDTTLDLSFIRNKIVLFGYLGRSLQKVDLTDRFFTPLNERPAGRTLPDMYGVVIHANIISMILRGDYINNLPEWAETFFNVILAYCFGAFFGWLYVEHDQWFDTISVVLQLAISLFLLFCQYLLFDYYRFRLGLTLCVAVVALSGNILEVYHDVLKSIARNMRDKRKNKKASLNNS